MLFTWSTEDLCIVFPKWHIGGPVSLFFSLLAIVLLTAGYEAVRQASQSYEARQLGTGRDGTIGASGMSCPKFPRFLMSRWGA